MVDSTLRIPGCDDCEGERGERGERGKRGHRGHRGHRGSEGPAGPAGPGGPATSLVGPTEGDESLIAAEDIPPGSVIATGSALLALASTDSTLGPRGRAIGVASNFTPAGQVVEYVAAGPLTLDTGVWDAVTGGSGGLAPNAVYYLSQTTPGHLTTVKPIDGQVVQVGIAFSTKTLDLTFLQLFPALGDTLTIIGAGTLTAIAYGYGRTNVFGSDSQGWQTAPPGSILPGTPLSIQPVLTSQAQQPADASAWLTSQVIGLAHHYTTSDNNLFLSGGLIELTEAQWNAVWTSADPNRGLGSGLLQGYPYYLSDVSGTFFLIGLNDTSPVGPGNYISRCFVALSPTVAMILLSDPRLNPAL